MEILDYDYKPIYKIPKDGKRRCGVELEITRKDIYDRIINDKYDEDTGYYFESDRYYEDREESAAEISKYFEGWCIFKHDGTVKGGFEIVTDPLFFKEQGEKWTEEVFQGLEKAGFISFAAQTAGHHVHVSRAGLSNLQIGKVLKFIHNKKNRAFIKKIAQRESKQHAEFSEPRNFGYLKYPGKDKYHAFNLKYQDTVEFRLFKGTLNHASFHKNLEFCEAILNFCAPCNTSVLESLEWFNFAEYVRANKNEYNFLWDFCLMKQMESTDSWAIHKEEVRAAREAKKEGKLNKVAVAIEDEDQF